MKLKENLICAFLVLLISVSKAAVSFAGEVTLNPRPAPERANQCRLCHMNQNSTYIPQIHPPTHQHQGHSLQHSGVEMSCGNCHDVSHFNYLRSTPEFPASFSNSSPVCQRCHSEIFRDWKNGIHGKRTGKWNGEKILFNCIDCHDPHSVKFKPMSAKPAPKKPRMGVPKTESKD